MGENKIKGTMLLDYVKMVRANRDRNWDKYLKPEDWEIINGRVLSAVWYEYETYERIGLAVFHEIAGRSHEITRAYGKAFWKNTMTNVYWTVISDNDPFKCLERFAILRKQFFNFSNHKIRKMGEKHVRSVISVGFSSPALSPFFSQLAGGFDFILEHCGVKNPEVELVQKEWEGAESTVFEITWE